MPTYIVTKNISIQIQNQFQDYFDSTDQVRWSALLKTAKKSSTKEIICKFPDQVSSDLYLWLELFKLIPNSKFAIENEELTCISAQMRLKNDPDDGSGADELDISLDADIWA